MVSATGEYTVDDGSLVVLWGGVLMKCQMKQTNRTEPTGVKSTVDGLTGVNSNGDLHWHWHRPLKPPEAIKVSLTRFSSPLWLSSCHYSRSTICRPQPFSPASLTLHSSSTKISRGSTAHNIFQCEAVPVFLRPTANTFCHQVTLPPSSKGARTGDSGEGCPCD